MSLAGAVYPHQVPAPSSSRKQSLNSPNEFENRPQYGLILVGVFSRVVKTIDRESSESDEFLLENGTVAECESIQLKDTDCGLVVLVLQNCLSLYLVQK